MMIGNGDGSDDAIRKYLEPVVSPFPAPQSLCLSRRLLSEHRDERWPRVSASNPAG